MMYMATDWVAKAGPPPVSAVMMSYSLSTVISEMTTLIVVAGATIRSVIIRNCWSLLAPSIELASYSLPRDVLQRRQVHDGGEAGQHPGDHDGGRQLRQAAASPASSPAGCQADAQ